MVQDVEFVPDVSVDNSNNTIIDVVTWLLPDSLFSMDDLTLYKDPLLLLHEHIQCRAWSDALAMYIDADVSIRQENRYEHVHQFGERKHTYYAAAAAATTGMLLRWL